MTVSHAEIESVVDRGSWMFDFYEYDGKSDYTAFVGDGVDDLDRLILMVENTKTKFTLLINVGLFSSDWRVTRMEDLVYMRSYVVSKFGEVSKIVL